MSHIATLTLSDDTGDDTRLVLERESGDAISFKIILGPHESDLFYLSPDDVSELCHFIAAFGGAS